MKLCRDAVPLVVTTESAYLLDDLETCIPRELWPSGADVYKDKVLVGVCHGVLCLCDDSQPGGTITLANPATGDALALPPIPCDGMFRHPKTRSSGTSWHEAYSLGYHHATGQYKVVHLPCFFKTKDALHVFTLGEASWREIPAPVARSKLEAGVVSADGATYWVTASGGWERIMRFDHETEQVTCTTPLPNAAKGTHICHLSEVQRRLSVAIATRDSRCRQYYGHDGHGIIQVWVLECARKEQTWNLQYSLRHLPKPGPVAQLARPSFIHGDGEYVLMVEEEGQKLRRYQHHLSNYCPRDRTSGAVHTKYFSHKGTTSDFRGDIRQTFAYVRTADALSVYKRW